MDNLKTIFLDALAHFLAALMTLVQILGYIATEFVLFVFHLTMKIIGTIILCWVVYIAVRIFGLFVLRDLFDILLSGAHVIFPELSIENFPAFITFIVLVVRIVRVVMDKGDNDG